MSDGFRLWTECSEAAFGSSADYSAPLKLCAWVWIESDPCFRALLIWKVFVGHKAAAAFHSAGSHSAVALQPCFSALAMNEQNAAQVSAVSLGGNLSREMVLL